MAREEKNCRQSTQPVRKPRSQTGERRRSYRRGCNLPAIIFIPGTSMAIPCTLVDECSAGARLRLSAARARHGRTQSYVPREFWVWMSVDRCRVKCEPIWENDDKIGVRFLSVIETAPPEDRNPTSNSFDGRKRFGPALRNQ